MLGLGSLKSLMHLLALVLSDFSKLFSPCQVVLISGLLISKSGVLLNKLIENNFELVTSSGPLCNLFSNCLYLSLPLSQPLLLFLDLTTQTTVVPVAGLDY